MARKILIKVTMYIAIVFFVLIGYSAYSIWTFSNKTELITTDAAVVLGAAAWEDEPSPVLRERINHSIWLYENDYIDKIIFTGGKGPGDQFAESEVAREYAIHNDVNKEDILIETKSQITEENLAYAYKVAAKHNLKTFTIVSDPLHMKRAMVMASNKGMKAYSSPTQSSVYKTWKSILPFFFRELFFYVGYLITLPFR